jgi:hypothetical protein
MWRFVLVIAISSVLVVLLPGGSSAAIGSAKIETSVAQKLAQGETTRALIVMAEQADVSAANAMPTKQAKGAYVYNTLRATAERTQAGVRAALERLGVTYRAYYVANVIAVENLDANAAAQLAARPEVGRIEANPAVKFSIVQILFCKFPADLRKQAENRETAAEFTENSGHYQIFRAGFVRPFHRSRAPDWLEFEKNRRGQRVGTANSRQGHRGCECRYGRAVGPSRAAEKISRLCDQDCYGESQLQLVGCDSQQHRGRDEFVRIQFGAAL